MLDGRCDPDLARLLLPDAGPRHPLPPSAPAPVSLPLPRRIAAVLRALRRLGGVA